MSTASNRPGATLVERAARQVLDAGLGRGDSAFTPGAKIWTPEAADELNRFYVERLDTGSGTFVEKLRTQLEGARPDAVQLAAELLYLNALPLANVSGGAKRTRIATVLSWLPEQVAIPADLDKALDDGVFSGGVGFNTMLWTQLVHLVAFVQDWWRRDEAFRQEALADPWVWKRFVESVGGGNAPSQRNALKYLAFPDTFEPIVNVGHRQRIRDAYKSLLGGPPADVDSDLLQIHQKLQEQSPDKPVDFYVEPWLASWTSNTKETPGRHAWLVRTTQSDQIQSLQRWLENGYVAVQADKLRELPPASALDDVREAVSRDYSSVEYVRQAELATGFHAVLTLMQPGDLVASTTSDMLHLGTLNDAPPQFDGTGAGDRLRRAVTWRTTQEPLPIADLPSPLPTHLATQGAVVDLSEDLDLLVALLEEDAPGSPGRPHDLPEVAASGPPQLKDVTSELAKTLLINELILQEWIDLLSDRQQIIFYGPPGTGKTYVAERLARFLADAGQMESERVALVQFHPSTSYEDFVEGYRPGADDDSGRVSFRLTPGPLSRIVSAARSDPQRPYFLIIDEINRANLAKVFGELYYLLEYRDSGIQLLYRPGKPFSLPQNVFLIGTMNTADRSIALVDAAMRRRFAFIELHPDDEPVRGLLRRWLMEHGKDTERSDLLEALNSRIEARDFKIGPSYLMKADAERAGGLDRVWKYSILPLMAEHHHGRLRPEQVELKYGLRALRADQPNSPSESAEIADDSDTSSGRGRSPDLARDES
jgi:5-methylcytosine-specific restriction protein B